MKSVHKIDKNKIPAVRIDSSLDKYDDVTLFPGKLTKANEHIKKVGFPGKTVTKARK